MANVVGEIVIDVTADVGAFIREMKRGTGAMSGFRGAADRMGSGLQKAGGSALAFGRQISIVAAGIAVVTGAALVFVRSAASMGDAIGDGAKAAGMSTTAFQEYRFALKEAADMTDQDFASAAAKLNKTLGEARQGSLSAIQAFQEIGVSQAQLADGAFTTDQAMAAFVSTMEATKDPAIAAALASDLFGKAGASIGAGLSGVPGQVQSLIDRARELGVVLGPDAVKAAGNFDQKMNELGERFDVLKIKLADKLLPVLVDDIIPAIERWVIPALESLGEMVLSVGTTIGNWVSNAVREFGEFKAAVGGAVDWVTGKFNEFMAVLDRVAQRVKDIVSSIRDAIPDISIGFGGSTYADPRAAGGGRAQPSGNSNSSGQAGGATGGQMMGAAIVNGAFMGAVNAMNEKKEAFAAVFSMLPQIARETLGIQSPSTVFAEIGQYVGEGLANGITGAQAMVGQAVSALGSGAVSASDAMVNDILGGMDTLLAGSKTGGAALAWINTLIGASQELKKGTFGFATMAMVIAKGAALVSAIKGGGNSSRSRGGSVGGSAAAGAGAAPQQAVQNLGITFVSDPFGYSERTARAIAAQVNQAQRNGTRLNVTVNG